MWSAGVITFILVTGRAPFRGKTRDDIFAAVKFLNPTLDEELSPACKSFLTQALSKDPEERPTAADLLDHPWLDESQQHKIDLGIANRLLKFRVNIRLLKYALELHSILERSRFLHCQHACYSKGAG